MSNRAAADISGLYKDGEGDFDIKEMVNFIHRPLKTFELMYDHKVPQ